jgi:hypothetical protein
MTALLQSSTGRAGKRSLKLHMIKNKKGQWTKRSHVEKYVKPNYFDTFRWDRAFMLGVAIGLIILWVTLGGK